jgi:DNA repair protein SbcC/Rad50
MIFNRFFRSKHLDPNPQVRIQAIAKLDKQLAAQKTVLHELAFNDPDAGVSLAALHKLDSFPLWYKMAETAKDERVQKKSQQVVEQLLFDESNTTLSEKEKRNFISQSKDLRLLEKCVLLPWIQADDALCRLILKRLDKPQLVEKILIDSPNESLQLALLNELSDESQSHKLLNKLSKKARSAKVRSAAYELSNQWQQRSLIPAAVEKDTRMVLAKLLALKDSTNLPHIQSQWQMLREQYAQQAAQFSYLSDVKAHEFSEKWQDLNRKLESVVARLQPEWEALAAEQALHARIDQQLAHSEQALGNIDAHLNAAGMSLAESDRQTLQADLQTHQRALQTLLSQAQMRPQVHMRISALLERLATKQASLDNLPAYQLCIDEAQRLLQQFSALNLPSDSSQLDAAQQYLREVKQQWREITARFTDNLPSSLVQAWQHQVRQWQQASKTLNDKINQDVLRCRNKLRAIDNLVSQGRFRLAIDLYGRVSQWYQALPEKQQTQLDKAFAKAKEQVEDLQDWQEYIAAPRKPALLNQAEQLVAEPLAIEQQAQAVKRLRQQWNSLGVIDNEADQALNLAFDTTLELAFAPCRAHYELQEQQRAANLEQKNTILQQLQRLAESSVHGKELSKQLNQIQQQWRNVGEVGHQQRQALNQQFHALLSPLKNKVQDMFANNAELKQHLITKAEKLLSQESLQDAVEEVKKLQQQWKAIEHAGHKVEEGLWTSFRAACDSVFAKRQAQQHAALQAANQHVQQVKTQLATSKEVLTRATNKAELDAFVEQVGKVTELLHNLPESVSDKEQQGLKRQIADIEELHKKRLSQLHQAQVQQQYQTLFHALEQWQDKDSLPVEVNELANHWQQAFNASVSIHSRHTLTIMLELCLDKASPNSDQAKRQAIQMQMMAAKLQDGELPSADELLKQWIACGPVSKTEQGYLARIQGLFV